MVYAPYEVAEQKYWVHATASHVCRDGKVTLYPSFLSHSQQHTPLLISAAAGDLSRERPTDGKPVIDTFDGFASLQIRLLIEKNAANTRDLLTSDGRQKLAELHKMLECGPLPTRAEVLRQFSAPRVYHENRPLDDFIDPEKIYYLYYEGAWLRAWAQPYERNSASLQYYVPAMERTRSVPTRYASGSITGIRFDLPPGTRSIDTSAQWGAFRDLTLKRYADLSGDLPQVVERSLIATLLGILPVGQADAGATCGTIDGRGGAGGRGELTY